jgi:hypothetical protein
MKHHFLAFIALGLIAFSAAPNARAQADLVKQKAQQIRDNNNAQQSALNGPSSAPAPAATSSYTPTPVSMPVPPANPEQVKLINHLESVFASIKPGVEATTAQKALLTTNISALSKVSTKPSTNVLNKLSSDLAAVLSEKALSAHDLQSLAAQISIVMNSSSLKGTVAQSYVMNADKIMKAANISAPAVQAVTGDLTGIVTTLQRDKPKLYQ